MDGYFDRVNGQLNGCMNAWMDECVDMRTEKWLHVRMIVWMLGWVDDGWWMNVWMLGYMGDKWVDAWDDKWADECIVNF